LPGKQSACVNAHLQPHFYLNPFLFLFMPSQTSCMTAESEAVKTVAGLMAISARTAPKAVGLDAIKIEILNGKDQDKLADLMIKREKS
jgi:hypothetical protein